MEKEAIKISSRASCGNEHNEHNTVAHYEIHTNMFVFF